MAGNPQNPWWRRRRREVDTLIRLAKVRGRPKIAARCAYYRHKIDYLWTWEGKARMRGHFDRADRTLRTQLARARAELAMTDHEYAARKR